MKVKIVYAINVSELVGFPIDSRTGYRNRLIYLEKYLRPTFYQMNIIRFACKHILGKYACGIKFMDNMTKIPKKCNSFCDKFEFECDNPYLDLKNGLIAIRKVDLRRGRRSKHDIDFLNYLFYLYKRKGFTFKELSMVFEINVKKITNFLSSFFVSKCIENEDCMYIKYLETKIKIDKKNKDFVIKEEV